MLPSLGQPNKPAPDPPSSRSTMIMSASSAAIVTGLARRDMRSDNGQIAKKTKSSKKKSKEKIQRLIQDSISRDKMDIFSWVITHILPIIQARIRGFLTRKHLQNKIDRLLKIQRISLRAQRVWTKPSGENSDAIQVTLEEIENLTNVRIQ
jgi:hypothetical protein